MPDLLLPPHFVNNITDVFPDGAAWLAALPSTLAAAADLWSLTLGDSVSNLSYNYVCYAVRTNGTPVVLKLCVPRGEIAHEIAALHFYNGRSAVTLLDADPDRGWLLLERIFPGTPLSVMEDDDLATRILAETLQRIWSPPTLDYPFPPLTDWSSDFAKLRERYAGGTGPFPESLIARAEATFSQPVCAPVLLHADFHHDNVLLAYSGAEESGSPDRSKRWVVIDPKGIVGHRLYDVGALLYNPFPLIRSHSNLRALLARRVAILAELLEADRGDIIEWGIAQAMLSSWWTAENHTDPFDLPVEVTVGEILASL